MDKLESLENNYRDILHPLVRNSSGKPGPPERSGGGYAQNLLFYIFKKKFPILLSCNIGKYIS